MDPAVAAAYLRQTTPVGMQTDDVRLSGIAEALRPRDESFLVSSIDTAVLSDDAAMLAMLSGVPLVLMSDRSGPAVAAAASRYRATIVVGFAVTFAELALQEIVPGDFALIERWVSVGDASHHAHVARLVEQGRHRSGTNTVPGSMFVDGFGSSEVGWGGVLGTITIPRVPVPHRCLGVAQPFADLAVLRPDGTRAKAGEVGLLGVKGPTANPFDFRRSVHLIALRRVGPGDSVGVVTRGPAPPGHVPEQGRPRFH
jgi:acyl-coenzyme A synthetase/AMP-(fatty) acid ligase